MLALEVVPLPVTDIDRALAFYAQHSDLGDTDWFTVKVGDRRVVHAAWRYTSLPGYAGALRDRVAFAWRAMDAFYEEDERIVGHAADAYHRIDIRQSSRHLVVKDGVRPIADTKRPVVLYESGFAPRWYVPREDIDESALVPADGQTFSPYKGLASYYDIGDHKRAAWYYPQAWPEVAPHLQPCFLRAGRGRRVPRRQETRPRAGSERHAARNRPRSGPRRDTQARRRPRRPLVLPFRNHVLGSRADRF